MLSAEPSVTIPLLLLLTYFLNVCQTDLITINSQCVHGETPTTELIGVRTQDKYSNNE